MLDRILNAQLIEAVASLLWPIGVFILALVYKEHVRLLLRRITGAKVFGNELKFDVDDLRRKIDETVEQQQANVPVATSVSPPPISAETSSKHEVQGDMVQGDTGQSEAKYWWRPAEERRAFYPNLSSRNLLPHPISVAALQRIYAALGKPKEALFLAAQSLEDAIISLLAAEGNLPPKPLRNVRFLARKLVAAKVMPKGFQEAVQKFSTFQTAVAGDLVSFGQDEIAEVARLGAELVELVERTPRDVLIVEAARLPVFAEEGCQSKIQEFECVTLIIAALPGSTGSKTVRLSRRIGYYESGRQVSSEWENNIENARWVWTKLRDDGKPLRVPSDRLFVGRHVEEIINS